jgi:hypothetical protein
MGSGSQGRNTHLLCGSSLDAPSIPLREILAQWDDYFLLTNKEKGKAEEHQRRMGASHAVRLSKEEVKFRGHGPGR